MFRLRLCLPAQVEENTPQRIVGMGQRLAVGGQGGVADQPFLLLQGSAQFRLRFHQSPDTPQKTELEMEVYANLRAAYEEIHGYLCYYDTKRRHSSLDYLTPWEFELSQK